MPSLVGKELTQVDKGLTWATWKLTILVQGQEFLPTACPMK